MPAIDNPVMPIENFNRHWNQMKYSNFREKFNIYTKKINEAFEEKDHNESVRKWRKLFGDEFGKLKDSKKSIKASSALGVGVIPTVAATKIHASND